jgi:phosphate transport system substrate-binding protein
MPAATPMTQMMPLRLYATSATLPLLQNLSSAYQAIYPNAAFALATGNYDSLVERILSEEGAYFLSTHLPPDIDSPQSSLWAAPIAQDALAVIVNAENPLEGITRTQLRDIYSGRVGQWDALGGQPQPIDVITREGGSGSGAEFASLVMGERAFTSSAMIAPSSSAMIESVARLPYAIGYASLAFVDAQVRPLAVDGVLPTADSVYDNTYPLRTTIYVVGRAEPLDSDYPAVRAFIGWAQSQAGQAVASERYVPLLRP